MHGRVDENGMAADRRADGAGAGGRCAQRPHVGRLLVAGRPQHGAGLADPPEPPSVGEESPHTPAPDLGHMGRSGSTADRPEGVSGQDLRVASVGKRAGNPREALHPQEQAKVVATPVSTGGVLGRLERQRYRCALTGRSLTPQTASLDHIVPIRCGGAHILENTQVLHTEVNRAKGSLTNEQFIGLCRQVVRWAGKAAREEER